MAMCQSSTRRQRGSVLFGMLRVAGEGGKAAGGPPALGHCAEKRALSEHITATHMARPMREYLHSPWHCCSARCACTMRARLCSPLGVLGRAWLACVVCSEHNWWCSWQGCRRDGNSTSDYMAYRACKCVLA